MIPKAPAGVRPLSRQPVFGLAGGVALLFKPEVNRTYGVVVGVGVGAALLSVARRSRFVAGCWGAGGGGMALPAFTARVRRVRA